MTQRRPSLPPGMDGMGFPAIAGGSERVVTAGDGTPWVAML